jgi:hypothetical protein
MKHFIILFLVVVCGSVTFVSFSAMHAGTNWANQLCGAASPLCNSPATMCLATAGLVSLWIMVAIFSAVTSA